MPCGGSAIELTTISKLLPLVWVHRIGIVLLPITGAVWISVRTAFVVTKSVHPPHADPLYLL